MFSMMFTDLWLVRTQQCTAKIQISLHILSDYLYFWEVIRENQLYVPDITNARYNNYTLADSLALNV